jgi:hypothetical protein
MSRTNFSGPISSPGGFAGPVDSTQVSADNIQLDGNTVSVTDTDGDLHLSANGAGTIKADSPVDIDNIHIQDNDITSTDIDGDINVTPNGTGSVVISKAQIGASGSAISMVKKGTVEVTTPVLAGGNVAIITATLTGAAVGDTLILNVPVAAEEAQLHVLNAYVSATDEIKIKIMTWDVPGITGTTEDWDYTIIR